MFPFFRMFSAFVMIRFLSLALPGHLMPIAVGDGFRFVHQRRLDVCQVPLFLRVAYLREYLLLLGVSFVFEGDHLIGGTKLRVPPSASTGSRELRHGNRCSFKSGESFVPLQLGEFFFLAAPSSSSSWSKKAGGGLALTAKPPRCRRQVLRAKKWGAPLVPSQAPLL